MLRRKAIASLETSVNDVLLNLIDDGAKGACPQRCRSSAEVL
jgi:hypothetical protein